MKETATDVLSSEIAETKNYVKNLSIKKIPAEFKEKKQCYVQRMFSSAAKNYDFLNSLLSFRLHYLWKKKAIKRTGLKAGDRALDVCSGTQDLAISMANIVGVNGHVTAVDLNREMLEIGDKKVAQKGLGKTINSIVANAQNLPLEDNQFDVATVAFGIRNVDDKVKGFSEMRRVLKPGGKVVCLEFSHPVSIFYKLSYDFYSFIILPILGKIFSSDNTGIYEYLPKSIRLFPTQENLKKIMEEAGLTQVEYKNLCGGIVAIHTGTK